MTKTYVHKMTGGGSAGGGAKIKSRIRNTKGGRRYSVETVEGIDKRRDSGGNVEIRRVIDRDSDRYREHIVDLQTGEVLRNVDERLSKHVGRGTQRQKKK
ncbi:MAG: hypothetical protein H6Q92_1137 [Nitrospirae bacterium]|nr:hypothetical protein [Nitrospirota bacterium]